MYYVTLMMSGKSGQWLTSPWGESIEKSYTYKQLESGVNTSKAFLKNKEMLC